MAVFKPSDMSPLLYTIDVEKTPQWFSCLVDTNNVNVDSYSITVLDSNNNVVFPKKYNEKLSERVTKLSDLKIYCEKNFKSDISKYGNDVNTGYNGSYIAVPFLIGKNDVLPDDDSTVSRNQIQNDSVLLNNDSYKWLITLYQGLVSWQGHVLNIPLDKYYDMNMSNGVVVGSTTNRIQSVISDKIFSDYYIQLYQINDLRFIQNPENPVNINSSQIYPIGNRVLIKSYDYVLGHIYPSENKIDSSIFESANAFQIYKHSNNPNDLTTYDKVSMVIKDAIDWKWVDEPDGSGYGIQTQTDLTEDELQNINVKFTNGTSSQLFVSQRIVLNGQNKAGEDDFDDANGSNHNGIFTITENHNKEKNDKYTRTIEFRRSPDANTWGKLSQKVVYVSGTGYFSGINIQAQSVKYDSENFDSYPKINETKIKFIPETPEEIYNYGSSYGAYANTTGPIFKTNDTRIYIRPSYNVQQFMKIQDVNSSQAYTINSLNDKYWYVNISGSVYFKPDETKYRITSFFRESDEAVFKTEKSPNVSVTLRDIYSSDIFGNSDRLKKIYVTHRNFLATASYNQENLHQWQSYFWILMDSSGSIVYKSEKKYDGEIRQEFYGLVARETYTLILNIQYDDGKYFEKTITVVAYFDDILQDDEAIDLSYDEKTGSSLIEIGDAEYAVVVPDKPIGSTGITYPDDGGLHLENVPIVYKKMAYDKDTVVNYTNVSESGSVKYEDLPDIEANDHNGVCSFEMQTTLYGDDDKLYCGDIVNIKNEDNNKTIFSLSLKKLTDRGAPTINVENLYDNTGMSHEIESIINGHCASVYQPYEENNDLGYSTDSVWLNFADIDKEYLNLNGLDSAFVLRGPFNVYENKRIANPFVSYEDLYNSNVYHASVSQIYTEENTDGAANVIYIPGPSSILDCDNIIEQHNAIVAYDDSDDPGITENYVYNYKNYLSEESFSETNENNLIDYDGDMYVNPVSNAEIGRIYINGEDTSYVIHGLSISDDDSVSSLQRQYLLFDGAEKHNSRTQYTGKTLSIKSRFRQSNTPHIDFVSANIISNGGE